MKLPEIIMTTPPEFNRTEILIQTVPPYVMAKIVKISDQAGADDYAAKQVDYLITRVDGYNIFLNHAGYMQKPLSFVEEKTVEYAMAEMADWYKKHFATKGRVNKYFKTK